MNTLRLLLQTQSSWKIGPYKSIKHKFIIHIHFYKNCFHGLNPLFFVSFYFLNSEKEDKRGQKKMNKESIKTNLLFSFAQLWSGVVFYIVKTNSIPLSFFNSYFSLSHTQHTLQSVLPILTHTHTHTPLYASPFFFQKHHFFFFSYLSYISFPFLFFIWIFKTPFYSQWKILSLSDIKIKKSFLDLSFGCISGLSWFLRSYVLGVSFSVLILWSRVPFRVPFGFNLLLFFFFWVKVFFLWFISFFLFFFWVDI